MSYESPERGNSWGVAVLVGIVIGIGFLVYFVAQNGGGEEAAPAAAGGPLPPAGQIEVVEPPAAADPTQPPPTPDSTAPETPGEILETLGIGVTAADPGLLVEQIGRNLEAGEIRAAANIIGRQALSDAQLQRLHELAAEARLTLNRERPISEIGELEINRRARWALNLQGNDGSRIYFDLQRGERGWGVERVTLPERTEDGRPPRAVLVDALAITDAFLNAADQALYRAKAQGKNAICVE